MHTLARAALALVVLAGCSHHTPAPTDGGESTQTTTIPTPPDSTSTATATPTATSAPASGLTGAWSSPSCGSKRTYAREITFADGGTWTARDLVSPCPKDAKCVWSGIVDRKGTSKLDGTVVTLTADAGADRQAGAPFPTTMKLDGGVLSEPSDDGGICKYKRN